MTRLLPLVLLFTFCCSAIALEVQESLQRRNLHSNLHGLNPQAPTTVTARTPIADNTAPPSSPARRRRRLTQDYQEEDSSDSADAEYSSPEPEYSSPEPEYDSPSPSFEEYDSPSPSPEYEYSPSPSPEDSLSSDTEYDSPSPEPASATPAGPAGCSATGVSCINLDASDPPQFSDPMTLLAVDLAEIAYNTSQEVDTYTRETLGAADSRFVSDSSTETQAVVVISSGAVIIAFRGTESGSGADWGTNTGIQLVSHNFGSGGSAAVHQGFLTAATSVFSDITSILNEVNASSKKIYVSGHSLGSALAMLAAAMIESDTSYSVSGVYSIGGPRVGGGDWIWVINVGRTVLLPAEADSCQETTTEEYDSCGAGNSVLDFVNTLGSQLACAGLGIPFATGFCGTAAADEASGGSNTDLVNLICDADTLGSLFGSVCCTLADTAAVYIATLGKEIPALNYHAVGTYGNAVANACTSECAYQQYQECGGGWTAENQAEFDAPLPEDSALTLTEDQVNQAVNAISNNSPSNSSSNGSNNNAATPLGAGLSTLLVLMAGLLLVATI